MHRLVRWRHECRCSRALGEDASFTDVKIRPQIKKKKDQGVWMTSCTVSVGWGFWGFEKKQWIEFLPPNQRVEIQSWARSDEFVRNGRCALVGLRADDVRAVCIERLCLSLLMSKNLWLKGNPIYLTPPLGQDMTQGQFFKRSLAGLNSEFSFS